MEKILPKYEVLFSDLQNLKIGEYLISRDFKLFMSKIGWYDQWKVFYEKVKSERSYYILGSNHDAGDSINTLAIYINAISEDKRVENLIVQIIVNFIESKKTKTNFEDLMQSLVIAEFNQSSIKLVNQAIGFHNERELPNEPIKKVSQKIIKKIEKADNIKENVQSNFKEVFIVHGHNEEIKQNVARLLEKLKLNPIILNEQSNEGMTIIEKFEKYSNVLFAIVLLTFDDYGFAKNDIQKNKRSRQNVILELGYFIGKIGRKGVLPLYEEGVELPNDISGVLYTIYDNSENWKFRVVKELRAAGFDVDANDIL